MRKMVMGSRSQVRDPLDDGCETFLLSKERPEEYVRATQKFARGGRGRAPGHVGVERHRQLHISASGALVYVPGPAAAGQENLMLFDRKGMAEVLKLPTGPHQYPRVAPDGRKIAFETSEGKESFIAVYDLSGASSMRRLTFGGNNHVPLWSRDSRRVAFQSDREGDGGIFWQSADGGPPERLTKPGPVMVTSTACHTP